MTEIAKVVAYICDFCHKEHEKVPELEVSGHVNGLSDMAFKFHYCNQSCLQGAIVQETLYLQKYPEADDDSLELLKSYLKPLDP